MYIRADLHCHGPEKWLKTSRWNPIDIARVVKGKLEVMAIVEMNLDDNRFEDLKKVSLGYEKDGRVCVNGNQIYVPECNLLIVRAQELATFSYIDNVDWRKNSGAQGHILVVGNKQKIPEGNLEESLNRAQSQGCAVIADHMFAGTREELVGIGSVNSEEKVIDYFRQKRIHAVEDSGLLRGIGVINLLFGFNGANDRALTFALNNEIPIVANSDSHSIYEMGRAHTLFRSYDSTWQHYLPFIIYNLKNGISGAIEQFPRGAPAFSSERHLLELAPEMLRKYAVRYGLRKS